MSCRYCYVQCHFPGTPLLWWRSAPRPRWHAMFVVRIVVHSFSVASASVGNCQKRGPRGVKIRGREIATVWQRTPSNRIPDRFRWVHIPRPWPCRIKTLRHPAGVLGRSWWSAFFNFFLEVLNNRFRGTLYVVTYTQINKNVRTPSCFRYRYRSKDHGCSRSMFDRYLKTTNCSFLVNTHKTTSSS